METKNTIYIPQLDDILNAIKELKLDIADLKKSDVKADLTDFSIAQTCEILQVSKATLNKYRQNKLICGYKQGKLRFYTRTEIENLRSKLNKGSENE